MTLQNINQRNSGGILFRGADIGVRNDGVVEDLSQLQIGTQNNAGVIVVLGGQSVTGSRLQV